MKLLIKSNCKRKEISSIIEEVVEKGIVWKKRK